MPYDAGINEIWDTMEQLDRNIRSQSERDLVTDQRELIELTMKMKYFDNPMHDQYMTPMFITAMVIVAILCTTCMCAFAFC